MTKKNTKRALLASVISMLLCVSMLIGSTFAWFTDNASTNVNTIQAGNLDVTLEYYDTDTDTWVDAEGKTLEFQKNTGMQGVQTVLWEPGCTYNLPKLRITNNGNLALKFKLAVTGIDGDAKLNEVIDWSYDYSYQYLEFPGTKYEQLVTVTGDMVPTSIDGGIILLPEGDDKLQNGYPNAIDLVISGNMQTTAGNEYQRLSIDGISVTVLATQVEHEVDSKNHMYDITAEYPVVDQAELDTALESAQPGDTISLSAGSYELPATLPQGVNIDANGATVTIPADGQHSRLYIDGTTISNAVIEGSNIVTSGDITFSGCTFEGNMHDSEPSDDVIFTDCVFNAEVHFASGSGAEVPGSDFVATNCVFNENLTLADFENATFTNCEFKGTNWAGKNMITYVEVGVNTFNNCTFTTGIRAAAGLTADDFVITDCNITIADVSNLG